MRSTAYRLTRAWSPIAIPASGRARTDRRISRRVVIGDRDEDVVTRDRKGAGCRGGGVVETLPCGAIERQRPALLERVAEWPGAREDAACHSPARVGIDTDRHGTPSRVLVRVSLTRPVRARPDSTDQASAVVPFDTQDPVPAHIATAAPQGMSVHERQSGWGWNASFSNEATIGFGSVRLWLVRTAMAMRSRGSQRTAARAPRNRPE